MSVSSSLHQRLDDAGRQIRLVSIDAADPAKPDLIVCQTETFQLEGNDRPSYNALSYQWNVLNSTLPIVLNGQTLVSTKNLVLALRRFREDDEVQYLWIDALCIDQNNLDEKKHQIPLMGKIYSYAEQVLVWLMGPGMGQFHARNATSFLEDWIRAAISAQQMDAIESVDSANDHQYQTPLCEVNSLFGAVALQTDRLREALGKPFDREKWMGIYAILQCPYWGRVWIVQEVMLARKARCFWENTSFDLATLLAVPKVLKMLQHPAYSSQSAGSKEQNEVIAQAFVYQQAPSAAVEMLSLLYETKIKSGISMSLAEIVDLTGGSEATDPRDRVFGLLGLVESQSTIVPDYSLTTAETYIRFTLAEIKRTKSLDVCFLSCGLVGRKTPDLPSWVPDLANNERIRAFSLIKKLRGLCVPAGEITPRMKISKAGHMLTLHGWRATQIHHIETKLNGEGLSDTLGRFYTSIKEFISTSSQIDQLPSSLSTLEVLFRTVVLDTSRYTPPNNLVRDEQHAAQLRGEFRTFGCYLDLIHDGNNALPSRDELHSTSCSFFQGISGDVQLNNQVISQLLGSVLRSNDLFWTEDGYSGLATHGMQPGDLVCILAGVCIPVILRPQDNGYILVGECYCFGLMYLDPAKEISLEVFDII